MLKLYHSPQSRSSRVVWLLEELDAMDQCKIIDVTIAHSDGTGGADKINPHPEGKVPVLEHDSALIMESGAIMLYLTDLFPKAGIGRDINDRQRGTYLSWLHYYGGVMEPVLAAQFSEMEPSAMFKSTFRGPSKMAERLGRALEKSRYLLGDEFCAADLLIVAPFTWFPAIAPDIDHVQSWIKRCMDRSAYRKMAVRDGQGTG